MFCHLVCTAGKNLIGSKDHLPWNGEIKAHDLEIYTNGDPVIISKKSFENFGYRLYSGKKILLVSRETMSLEEALTETQDEKLVFIAGGLSLFNQTFPIISSIWNIRIAGNYNGDTYYTDIPKDMKFVMARTYTKNLTGYLYERVNIENNA